jgi:hypothetical protein
MADTEVVHSLELMMVAHNCCSYLVQEGSLVAGLHTVADHACNSHNHHPGVKHGAEDPASDPSPCRLLVVAAVDSRHRAAESMAHSEVGAPLVDSHHRAVENVAPTENLDHDSEGGDVEDHSHQSELHFLEMSDS